MADGAKLALVFMVPGHLTDDEIHDMGERIVTELVTSEPVTFEETEVRRG